MVLAPWQSGAVISNQEFPKSSQVAQFANVQQPVNLTKEKWQLLVTIKGMSHYKHCWHCCTVALSHCRTVDTAEQRRKFALQLFCRDLKIWNFKTSWHQGEARIIFLIYFEGTSGYGLFSLCSAGLGRGFLSFKTARMIEIMLELPSSFSNFLTDSSKQLWLLSFIQARKVSMWVSFTK